MIVLRAAVTLGLCLAGAIELACRLAIRSLLGASRDDRLDLVASAVRQLAERLGPSYIKIGQILSTRRDLFGSRAIAELARLQDRAAPIRFGIVPPLFRRELGVRMDASFSAFDPTPVASGSIASVYRARLLDGRVVAVKIRRPDSVGLIRADLRLLRPAVRLAGRLPLLRLVPVADTFEQLGRCLERQLDFRLEAAANRRLRSAFAEEPGITIPAVVEELCSESILTMEYVPGFDRPAGQSTESLRVAVRALFRMIFIEGFVHCDMHQGNVRLLANGKVALIDFGFMADVPGRDRHSFADFFLAIAHNDGRKCARITIDIATVVPVDLPNDRFEQEVIAIVERASGATAGAFQVADFVTRMFDVQRRFGIRGTTAFTMAILSLLVFEGIAKDVDPDLDFQREALPFILWAQVEDGRRYTSSLA